MALVESEAEYQFGAADLEAPPAVGPLDGAVEVAHVEVVAKVGSSSACPRARPRRRRVVAPPPLPRWRAQRSRACRRAPDAQARAVTSVTSGRATAASSAIWPSPRIPSSTTSTSVSGSSRSTVSGARSRCSGSGRERPSERRPRRARRGCPWSWSSPSSRRRRRPAPTSERGRATRARRARRADRRERASRRRGRERRRHSEPRVEGDEQVARLRDPRVRMDPPDEAARRPLPGARGRGRPARRIRPGSRGAARESRRGRPRGRRTGGRCLPPPVPARPLPAITTTSLGSALPIALRIAERRSGSISTSSPAPCNTSWMIAIGSAARIVRRHEHDVTELHGNLAHQRTLGAVPSPPARRRRSPSSASSRAARRASRASPACGRNRRARRTAARRPPARSGRGRHAPQRRLRDLVRVEVEQQSGGDGGENVFDVEQSAQRGLHTDAGSAKRAAACASARGPPRAPRRRRPARTSRAEPGVSQPALPRAVVQGRRCSRRQAAPPHP